MRVCFLLERGTPPRRNRVITETIALLERRGAQVQCLYPEEELVRLDTLAVEADIYLHKSDTELALSLAAALECLGARVVNCAAASARAKNKVLAAATLLGAGIPAPRTLVAGLPAQLAAKLVDGPLMLKPYRGYHGMGITVVDTPRALPAPESYPDLVFAQEYLARARTDLKIFAIGDQVFSVRKAFTPDSFRRAGERAPMSPELEDLARRCGLAFGLALYGLDIAEDERGAWVVDVNYFPGYRGVPNAAHLLAAFVQKAARE
jgi:ribosomal protein S6--L-glutamate ligase